MIFLISIPKIGGGEVRPQLDNLPIVQLWDGGVVGRRKRGWKEIGNRPSSASRISCLLRAAHVALRAASGRLPRAAFRAGGRVGERLRYIREIGVIRG